MRTRRTSNASAYYAGDSGRAALEKRIDNANNVMDQSNNLITDLENVLDSRDRAARFAVDAPTVRPAVSLPGAHRRLFE
ncbi:MAG: hypothetical protein H0T89_29490 [Deltaproteobacteria bacterium]|nr:hypothetical protein [Deltaproteobacteria bacterium]MDQ3300057.1 hypothetical protein [Myxococcota bacterium]